MDFDPVVLDAIERRLAALMAEIDALHAAERPGRMEIAWRMADEGRLPEIADIAAYRVRLGVLDAAERVPLSTAQVEALSSRAGAEVAALERMIERIEADADLDAA